MKQTNVLLLYGNLKIITIILMGVHEPAGMGTLKTFLAAFFLFLFFELKSGAYISLLIECCCKVYLYTNHLPCSSQIMYYAFTRKLRKEKINLKHH
jgi:hypothetical protein